MLTGPHLTPALDPAIDMSSYANESENDCNNEGIATPTSSQSDSGVGIGTATGRADSTGLEQQLEQLCVSTDDWHIVQQPQQKKKKKKKRSKDSKSLPAPDGSNYFGQFIKAGFRPTPTAPIEKEFKRLAAHMKWHKTFVQHRNECYAQELEHHSHADLGPLEALQTLCTDLGIKTAPSTITQCKKVQYTTRQQRNVIHD